MQAITLAPPTQRLSRELIESRVKACAPLPSLSRVNSSLRGLLSMEENYTARISEVIRRDPSLSSRILQMVNSVYFALSTPIQNIEEAVLYLGMEQIRRLALITPIVEDFQKLARDVPFTWREFWQHCIGTAILTREIVGPIQRFEDEADYVAGLVHDVGKIVMASVFPNHFVEIHQCYREVVQDLKEVETFVLGMDHTELGAIYLLSHRVPEIFVEAARFHHCPEHAGTNRVVVAAVQIADLCLRYRKIGASGDAGEVTLEQCFNASGWKILFPIAGQKELPMAQARLQRLLEGLPATLEGMV
ncbi:MAG TPA: HDOD domain-containing protein [Verrucomicrobiae bacterium]|jgi:HD-like signal output (HDOD) protein